VRCQRQTVVNAAGRSSELRRALPDARSGRVVFISHCLLNQNTRYLGGAVCPGVVSAAVAPYADAGTGIVQLPCPEQLAWGGVQKTRLLWVLRHRWSARAGSLLAPLATAYLRRRYRRLARAVVSDINDYVRNGYVVTGVIGVAGSPTCGVHSALDLGAALAAISRTSHDPITTGWMNDAVIGPAIRDRRGLFMQAVADELRRQHLSVVVTEHSLKAAN